MTGGSQAIEVDCAVVGAGVIGLAVARALQLAGLEVALFDMNRSFGMETSSRNSEVIHAGIYYPEGSLKAEFCVRGKGLLYEYCRQRGVPHRRIGKLIVATSDAEVATLDGYRTAATKNGVLDLVYVSREELAGIEPAVSGEAAMLSPSTGIIDSHAYMLALLHDFEMAGGHFVRSTRIVRGEITASGISLTDSDGEIYLSRRVVNSCGLLAPSFAAQLIGFPQENVPPCHFSIGHYFSLTGKSPFNRLVYPVAVVGGLGTHVTLDMQGAARFGPDVSWIDTIDYTFDESRKSAFAESIRRYYPALDEDRLVPAYTGIRPKIAGPLDPAADFLIQTPSIHGIEGLINLFGIESPGLTSSLAIGEHVAGLIGRGF